MYGKSWGGFNGLQVAARQPPGLAAVISLYSTDDRYEEDIHWKVESLSSPVLHSAGWLCAGPRAAVLGGHHALLGRQATSPSIQ